MSTMNGKICLVTGATDGIGKVTARELAAAGADVIVVGRSQSKTEQVVAEIKQQTGNNNVEFMLADLSSMQQVRDLAAAFKRDHDRLDVLVNNAGAIFMSRRESVDGLEMTFALNHVGYFLLTNLLIDVLKASAPARIVSVSSSAHYRGHVNFDDLQHAQHFSGFQVYSDSKLMNVLFTYELARRLEGTGVTANTLHPGVVATNFMANNWGILGKLSRRLLDLGSISAEKGAQTSIYLATSPEVEGVTGEYFDKKKSVKSAKESYDQDVQRRLWETSIAITQLQPVV
jgi:retinol dehydrogenase 12